MRKKFLLLYQLQVVTRKVAEACDRCSDRDDRFRTCAQLLLSICDHGEVKNPASIVATEALEASFQATIDGRPGHQHVAAAARLIAQVWFAVESLGNDNLPDEVSKAFSMAQRELKEGEPGVPLDNYTSRITR